MLWNVLKIEAFLSSDLEIGLLESLHYLDICYGQHTYSYINSNFRLTKFVYLHLLLF